MNRKQIGSIILIFFLMIGLGTAVFAENGDGTGGSDGKDPPELVSSSVPDGSTDVDIDEDIILNFNKNVVNFTVKENNMKCFSMVDSKGNSVVLTVIMGDDQVDRDIRRIITIHPDSLKEGETYTLTISKNLQAKNGLSMEDDVIITFTTVMPSEKITPSPTSAQASSDTSLPSPSVIPTASSTPTVSVSPSESVRPHTGSAVGKKTSSADDKERQGSSLVTDFESSDENSISPHRIHSQPIAVYVILGIILLAVLGYLLSSSRSRKNNDTDQKDQDP